MSPKDLLGPHKLQATVFIVSPNFLGPHELQTTLCHREPQGFPWSSRARTTLLQIFNVEGCCVCGGGCGLGGDQVRRAGPFAGPSHRAFGLLRPEWQAAPDRVATVPQRGQETETEKRGGGGKVGLGLLRTLFCQQGIGAPKPGWPWQFFAWYALSLHLSVPAFEVQCVSRPPSFFPQQHMVRRVLQHIHAAHAASGLLAAAHASLRISHQTSGARAGHFQ